eukprot:jgi/Psemu1/60768/gm1.60768_g
MCWSRGKYDAETLARAHPAVCMDARAGPGQCKEPRHRGVMPRDSSHCCSAALYRPFPEQTTQLHHHRPQSGTLPRRASAPSTHNSSATAREPETLRNAPGHRKSAPSTPTHFSTFLHTSAATHFHNTKQTPASISQKHSHTTHHTPINTILSHTALDTSTATHFHGTKQTSTSIAFCSTHIPYRIMTRPPVMTHGQTDIDLALPGT